MKRIIRLIAASLAFTAVFSSCRDLAEIVAVPEFRLATPSDTETTLMAYGENMNYTLEATYFQYAGAADAANEVLKSDRFNVYSNCKWRIVSAEDGQDWVHPYPEYGGDQEGQIFFRINRNNDQNNDRTAYFQFVLNDGEKDITVPGYFVIHQDKAIDFLKTNITKADVANSGGTQRIRIQSNKQWTYAIAPMEEYATPDLDTWLADNTEHPADQLSDTLVFKLPNNVDGTIRGFNVSIICPENPELNKVIPVTQFGADVEIEGFPVQWTVGVAGNNYTATWPAGGLVNSTTGKGTIIYNNEAGKAVDVNNKTLFDVSGNCPRVTGAWPGDYCQFTADAPVPGGSIMKISFETRTSATNPKYWKLYYLDGSEWKVAGQVRTA
ncbi:MAG: hypothetical protein HUJ94_00555, partial [Bacteroidales bacterium]|nr:hypothetical protein [Bacteroidales bacterium]